GGFLNLADDFNDTVNINLANHQELMTLPGIGEKYAQAIIDYRQEEGFFDSIEQIKKVKGIGDKIFEDIKNRLEI
ncbi:MAG: Helix-hairpin-helix repeat-containing competence protein ComEA, partial [Microgenomates bacterium 39_7]